MGNRPPKPPQKPPPEEGGGGGGCQKPPPGGGQNPAPPPPGSQKPPPSSGDGCQSCGSGSESPQTGDPQPAGPSHPLNQLNETEIRDTVRMIKAYAQSHGVREQLIFASVTLKEPIKAELFPFLYGEGARPPRRSWAVVSPTGINTVYDVIVNLDQEELESFNQMPQGTQPSFHPDDAIMLQDFIRKQPEVIEKARKAGITNMEQLMGDVWSYGYNDTDVDKEKLRLAKLYLYKINYEGDNQYAHPLDFLVAVDIVNKKIAHFRDLPVCPGNEPSSQERPIPPPQESHNYDPRVMPQGFYRTNVKPLEICQSQGPSFKIDGNTISWQNWEMIIGFNFREGLTFHNITFNDHGTKRGVLYRAAISEMVVPYGDARIPFYSKSGFDIGEFGLGYSANSLKNGCDCLGEIRYMDFVYSDSKGEPKVTRNAICIHEEDAGLLQKHTEFRNNKVTIARSRKLVISFIATVANYDYGFYWHFFQDGTIEMNVKATGLLSVHSLGLGQNCGPAGYGTIIVPRIFAPYHQHIFCARLDTMVDGPNNTVAIQEVIPLEEQIGGDVNPFGQGFTTRYTILERAAESGTDTEPDLTRSWLVANENELHPYTNQPVSWKLVTPGFGRILAGPDSGIYKRAGFARHNVWVTPYDDEQLYAAGKFINQAPGDQDGLNIWVEDDGDIRNRDIVLWHTFGLNHIPRVEDFPLMPVEGVSFIFRPSNFFTANPALDVPAPKKKDCST